MKTERIYIKATQLENWRKNVQSFNLKLILQCKKM